VIYGVRPEHVLLGGEEGTIGQVAVVGPTGSETFVMVKIKDREIVRLIHERRGLHPGQEVQLSVAARASQLLDAGTGLRL